ncbi:hypothetical protein THASP1DRAFT_33851 [Thamnocephalis sphaerospora]|uniref:Ras-associating domain-containing protein n=1 Tax=Thamnocephalis sphaerospora TaxID=78915 RepID=A0A4V1IVK6_9FUNG|nr:hypothetical protein THASP1DRAFT_33851 [Thamnocephalis sphaerospora]|eukprot:RKP04389.1 hypothetical protein THASP1DRAFT_33851 [Thamnocephalis sphaerospora]
MGRRSHGKVKHGISGQAKTQYLMEEMSQVTQELKMLRDQLLPALRKIVYKQSRNHETSGVSTSPSLRQKDSAMLFPTTPENLGNSSGSANVTPTSAHGEKRGKPAALNIIASASNKTSIRSSLPFLQKSSNKDKLPQLPPADKHSAALTAPGSPFSKDEAAHLAATRSQLRDTEPLKSPAAAELDVNTVRVYGERLPGRETEAYKSVRITIESTSQQILDLALRKYDLMEDGKDYTLLIVHNNRERPFGPRYQPLRLYQQLKQANEDPRFVMRPNKWMKRSNAISPVLSPALNRQASLQGSSDARAATERTLPTNGRRDEQA